VELGEDLWLLFQQFEITSDRAVAELIAIEIAAKLAGATGWFHYGNVTALMEAWYEVKVASRAGRRSRPSRGTVGGPTSSESDRTSSFVDPCH